MNENQEKIIKDLALNIFNLMRDGVKEMWREEDQEFLRQLSVDVAREKVLAEMGDNSEEHIKNLEHLAATLQGEITRKGLKIRTFRRDAFIKILTMIIKTVAVPVLKTVIEKKMAP